MISPSLQAAAWPSHNPTQQQPSAPPLSRSGLFGHDASTLSFGHSPHPLSFPTHIHSAQHQAIQEPTIREHQCQSVNKIGVFL